MRKPKVGTDDLAYHLASFGARADLFQVEYDPATRNMVSANITAIFVLMAIREGWLNQDDEITHIYYDGRSNSSSGIRNTIAQRKGWWRHELRRVLDRRCEPTGKLHHVPRKPPSEGAR